MSVFRALRHRNFALFWSGQLVSLVGTWMQTTAQGWLVYRLTGSPLALGTVAFAASLPSFFLTLAAGVVGDRLDRRRVLVAAQSLMMVQAFVLAALTYAGVVQFWHVIVLAALLGSVNAVEMPTRQAFVVEMVGREDLMNAIALNSSIFNAARIVGPAVAGLIIATIGEAPAFLLNGVSFGAVIAGLLLIRTTPVRRSSAAATPWRDLIAGLRYVRADARITTLIALVAVPSLFGWSYTAQMPVFADRVLGLGAEGYGQLLTATGVGALTAGLALASLSRFRRKGLLVTAGSLTFAAVLLALSFARDGFLAAGLLMVIGWATVTHLATTNTLLQTGADDAFRARVLGVYIWTVNGLAPFGQLAIGAIAQATSAPDAIRAGAAVCLAAALGIAVARPEIRRAEA